MNESKKIFIQSVRAVVAVVIARDAREDPFPRCTRSIANKVARSPMRSRLGRENEEKKTKRTRTTRDRGAAAGVARLARTAPPAIAADLDAVRADMATADIVEVSRARVVRVVRVVPRPRGGLAAPGGDACRFLSLSVCVDL